MFNLFFSNIPDRGLVGSFETLEAARSAGLGFGFEFRVEQAGRLIGSWEIFRGWRSW